MHNYKKRGFSFNTIDKLGIISLLTNLSIALVVTIWAIYLESILKNISYVGFLTGFLTFIGIFASILFVPFIEKNNKPRLFVIAGLIFALTYLLFSVVSNVLLVISLGLLMTLASVIKINSFGIIVRDKSKDSAVSKNVGLIYTFFNISWVIGPVIAGFLAERYGIRNVFIISAAIMIISVSLFKMFSIKDERTTKKIDKNFLKLVLNFLKNKDRRLIYILSGGISFWNTLVYIYLPILIIQSAGNDLVVGYFLSGVTIPLIALEYYFGKLTGKIGFKKIFFRGYSILAISAISCFFISNLYAILGIIILGGIGIAMLESTTESYFFDIVKKNQRDKYYGPYNTTIEINTLLSSIILAGVLLFLPFKFVFLIVGIFMATLAFLSLKIRNIVEAEKR
jgi:MFS transporter, DHA1 family, multidrug resistance protein